jgi:hypothetical protein
LAAAGLALAAAAVIGTVACQSPSPTPPAFSETLRLGRLEATADDADPSIGDPPSVPYGAASAPDNPASAPDKPASAPDNPASAPDNPASAPDGALPQANLDGAVTEADGIVPENATVFDDGYPGVAKLAPDLLRALREAAATAADAGIEFHVNSGWRSPEYQNQLLREAISEYGSEAEASRWVATADKSAHVKGDAVDIGPWDAAAWLSEHGAEYGLCQTYRNEPWHFELRPEAMGQRCPRMHADPTSDPRTQSEDLAATAPPAALGTGRPRQPPEPI